MHIGQAGVNRIPWVGLQESCDLSVKTWQAQLLSLLSLYPFHLFPSETENWKPEIAAAIWWPGGNKQRTKAYGLRKVGQTDSMDSLPQPWTTHLWTSCLVRKIKPKLIQKVDSRLWTQDSNEKIMLWSWLLLPSCMTLVTSQSFIFSCVTQENTRPANHRIILWVNACGRYS